MALDYVWRSSTAAVSMPRQVWATGTIQDRLGSSHVHSLIRLMPVSNEIPESCARTPQ